MRSVADDLRDEQMREMLAMTPGERIELALRLGEEAIQIVMSTQNVGRDEAIRRIAIARRSGRRYSRSHDDE